jgi:hypothetical protein
LAIITLCRLVDRIDPVEKKIDFAVMEVGTAETLKAP